MAKRKASGEAQSVEEAALVIAEESKPGMKRAPALEELDAMAARVKKRLRGDASAMSQAEALAEVVYGEYGFTGNRDDYYDPRNSYLDDVLLRRTGIPITLAVILIAVGRRAGVLVEGIGFPGHFLARVGGEDGILLDPFDGGHVLSRADLESLAKRYLGDPAMLRPEHLEVASTETMTVRMLVNLQHAHRRRGDFARAMLAVDRLVDLTGDPDHRRDRGLLAIALGSYQTAAADLEAYIDARPTARDVPTLEVALEQVKGQLGRNLQ